MHATVLPVRLLLVLALGLAGRAFSQVTADRPVVLQNVTEGRNVTLSAGNAAAPIQWQLSTDGGRAFSDLAESSAYVGTKTKSLEIVGATSDQANYQFRFVSTGETPVTYGLPVALTVSHAYFPMPTGITTDSKGRVYISDESTHSVYQCAIQAGDARYPYLSQSLMPFVLAGKVGEAGTADGAGAAARFNRPAGLSVQVNGPLMVADSANGTIRQVSVAGVATTLAGNAASRGNVDGIGTAAQFSSPSGIVRGPDGTFYVADAASHTIRRVEANGTVTTFAGSPGNAGWADGPGPTARFNHPEGIAIDGNGRIYVADTMNNLIRTITPDGVVSTIAGLPGVTGFQEGAATQATFNAPCGVAVTLDGRFVFVADTGNSTIRMLVRSENYAVRLYAGTPTVSGLSDGADGPALFDHPRGIAINDVSDYYALTLYVADTGNAAVRTISFDNGVQTLLLGNGLVTNNVPPPFGLVNPGTSPAPTTPAPSATTPAPSGESKGGGAMDGGFVTLLAGLLLLRWSVSRRNLRRSC